MLRECYVYGIEKIYIERERERQKGSSQSCDYMCELSIELRQNAQWVEWGLDGIGSSHLSASST